MMIPRGWRRLALAGLLGALGLAAGCEGRKEGVVREHAREAGRAVNELGQELDKAAQDARETTNEAIQGFKEGYGGSGEKDMQQKDAQQKDGATTGGKGQHEQNNGR